MSKPSLLSRSSSSESLVETFSQATPAKDDQSKSTAPPVMKAKTKKSDQGETYKANTNTSATHTKKNHNIHKNFETEIGTVRQSNKIKIKLQEKFSNLVTSDGILILKKFLLWEIRDLVEWLKANPKVKFTKIDLSNSNIGPEGAKALAEALKSNTTITELNLNNNLIGPKGVKAIGEAIMCNPNSKLTTLSLFGTDIGAKGVKSIAGTIIGNPNSKITTLDLGGNKIDDEGAMILAESLKGNKTITTLGLGYNYIYAKGIKALVESLKANATLTTLNLSNNKIAHGGVKALTETLKTNTTITTLCLRNNNISDEGAKVLAESLKGNKTIGTLDLIDNNIGGEGFKALAELTENNPQITELLISESYFYNEEAKKYKEIIKNKCSLNIQNIVEKNIAAALDLLTAHPNPIDGNATSNRDVNDVIANNLFVLDKAGKLNTSEVIANPNNVFNKYT